MCKYPLGSGGKRVTMVLYFPFFRSSSTISSKKLLLFSSGIVCKYKAEKVFSDFDLSLSLAEKEIRK